MLWGGNLGALDVRSEGGETRLRASFPYGAQTELAPGRHEVIAPRAFADRIDAGEDIHLLFGHSFDKPLASRAAGTLALTDTDAALVVEARIDGGTSWARDFLAAHASGLIRACRLGSASSRAGNGSSGAARTICALSCARRCSSCRQSPGPPTAKRRSRRGHGKRTKTGNPCAVRSMP
jgi:HK97 family phage prohead protease